MSRQWREILARLFYRVGAILLLSAGAIALPDLQTDSVLKFKNAIVALVTVVAIGKTL